MNDNDNNYNNSLITEEIEDNNIFLDILDIFFSNFWIIILFTLLGLGIGLLQAWRIQPVYQANSLLRIDLPQTNINTLGISDPLINQRNPIDTEITVLRTRPILNPVVESLDLNIKIKPKYFPFIGQAYARSYQDIDMPKTPPLPIKTLYNYVWGGTKIAINQILLPDNETLILQANTESSFNVYDNNYQLLFNGQANQVLQGTLPSGKEISLKLSEFKATPGNIFYIQKTPIDAASEQLKGNISIREYGRGTNILQISVRGNDYQEAIQINNALAKNYVKDNIEKKSQETEQTLAFIQEQLPRLKEELDNAQTLLKDYKAQNGSFNLNLEVENYLQELKTIESSISALKLQRIEISQIYTKVHPARQTLERKISQLEATKRNIDNELKNIPGLDWKGVQLERDVEIANELYLLLLNKKQELDLVKAGTVGNVEILEQALYADDITPSKAKKVIFITFLFSVLSFGIGFLRKILSRTIIFPEQIEKRFKFPVYGTILLHLQNNKKTKKQEILSAVNPQSPIVESLRSLRASTYFSHLDAKNNIIAIIGATPGLGKTFISVNLSYLFAEANQTTILIDTDLRRGKVHRYFDFERSPGLSDYIQGTASLEDIIHKTKYPNLFVISGGTIPPNPAELIMNERFKELLGQASKHYQTIILDTSPILNVSDSILITKLASTNMLVVRSELTTKDDVERVRDLLAVNNLKIKGTILNALNIKKHHPYGRYNRYKYYYYSYNYKS